MAQKVYNWPEQTVSMSPTPIQYEIDGVPVTVNKDTVTPANSTALPVEVLSNGTPIDLSSLAQETTLQSIQSTVATTAAQTDGTQKTQIVDGSGNVIGSTSNALDVNVINSSGSSVTIPGYYDVTNSTNVPLGPGGTYVGTAIDITNYATVSIAAASDVESATGGLQVQFGPDGVNWDHVTHVFDVPAGGLSYNLPCELRFMRIVYTNGAVAQSYFRLTCVLRQIYVPPSVYTMNQGVYDGTLGTPTKSVIFGKTTGGGSGYVPVKVNPSGALSVSATQDTSPWVVSGTVTANAGTDLNTSALALENGGNLEILVAQGASEYNLNSLTVSGVVIVDVNEKATLSFSTTGTWSGSISVLGSVNGVYTNIYYYQTSTRDAYQNFSTNTLGIIDCAGFQAIKFVGSGFSGTATIETFATRQTGAVVLSGSLPSGVNVIGSVGSIVNALPTGNNVIGSVMQNGTWNIGSISNALPGGSNTLGSIKLTDGTNTAVVKAASTAAVATDPALVVAISPNNTISTIQGANSAGSYAEITNLTTTAQTFTKPANAVGFILETLSDNTVNVRYKIGATATTTSGMRMEPGRDTGYVPCAANISVIAESGSNQVVTVQWVLSA